LFVGPGFEIVVRAGERRPFDVKMASAPGRAAAARRAVADPDLHLRVEAVESSLAHLVRQLQGMESKVDEVVRSARTPAPRA
jgi:hypothetical protein